MMIIIIMIFYMYNYYYYITIFLNFYNDIQLVVIFFCTNTRIYMYMCVHSIFHKERKAIVFYITYQNTLHSHEKAMIHTHADIHISIYIHEDRWWRRWSSNDSIHLLLFSFLLTLSLFYRINGNNFFPYS